MPRLWPLIALFPLLLSACSDRRSSTPATPTPPVMTTLTGLVTAGPVDDATVEVYSVDTGTRALTKVGTTQTTLGGQFSVRVPGPAPFLCIASGGRFRDEATGAILTLAPAPMLQSLDDPRPRTIEVFFGTGIEGTVVPASINPLTKLASIRATTASITSSTVFTEAGAFALNEQVAREFGLGTGLDLRSIQARDLTNPADSGFIRDNPTSPEVQLGVLLAGFSALADFIPLSGTVVAPVLNGGTVVLGALNGPGVDPLALGDALAEDSRDGVFDGRVANARGAAGPISFNGSELSPTAATTDLSAATQTFLNNPTLNVSGTNADSFLALTNAIATRNIEPANFSPTFGPLTKQTLAEDSGPVTLDLTNISAGSPAEDAAMQNVAFSVIVGDPRLLTASLNLSNGAATLTLTPNPNANGVSSIIVIATDDGPGKVSFERIFDVGITPVNDAPRFDMVAAQTVSEDSQIIVTVTGVDSGPANESHQSIGLTAISSDTAIIPNPTINGGGLIRDLVFNPTANANGMVTITLSAMDDGGTSNSGTNQFQQTFTIMVNSINDPPSFDAISNQSVFENSKEKSINIAKVSPGPADESMQAVALTATSSNTAVIPDPVIMGSGDSRTLMFGPVNPVNGKTTVVITVTAMDDGGKTNGGVDSAARSFNIVVNDLPSITDVMAPTGELSSCVEISYTVTGQLTGATSSDILVEVSPSATGKWTRATQAGSDSVGGVVNVAAAATGTAHKFLWNSTRDFPGLRSSDGRLRISAVVDDAVGSPMTITGLTIANDFKLTGPTSLDIGSVPVATARADLNEDGNIDLIVVGGANTAFVFLQNPATAGSFQAPQSFAAGMANLISVGVGDFNKDGKRDLIVGDDGGTLTVLLQDSANFGFAAGATLSLGGMPGSMKVKDMDEDGDLDVVVANGLEVFVVMNNGKGILSIDAGSPLPVGISPRFSTPTALALDSSGSRAIVYDDGLDALLAVELASNTRSLLSNSKDGLGNELTTVRDFTFDSSNGLVYVTETAAQAVLSVNLSTGARTLISSGKSGAAMGSGTAFSDPRGIVLLSNSQLLVIDRGNQSLVQVEISSGNRTDVSSSGNGTGNSLMTPTALALDSAANRVYVIDEGGPSIVSIDISNNTSRGARSTISQGGNIAVGTGDAFVTPTDIILDNNRLLIVDQGQKAIIAAEISTGNRTPISSTSMGSGDAFMTPTALALGSNTELLVLDDGNNRLLEVVLASGNRSTVSDNTIGTNPTDLEVADLDGDGRQDVLVTAGPMTNTLLLLRQLEPAQQTDPTTMKLVFANFVFANPVSLTVGDGVADIATADIDGDGARDILTANTTSNNLSLLRSLGTSPPTFAAAQTIASAGGPVGVAISDINGDGRLDIVSINNMANTALAIFQDSTPLTFKNPISKATGAMPVDLVTGDLNKDGKGDIALVEMGTSKLSIIQGTKAEECDPGFSGTMALKAGKAPRVMRVADMDKNGKPDLLVVNRDANNVSFFKGLGNGSFAAKTDVAVTTSPRDIAVGDLNNDGALDFATADLSANSVSVVLQDGASPGSFLPATPVAPGDQPSHVAIGDLNNDGFQDLAVSIDGVGTIVMLLQDTAMPGTFAAAQDLGTGGAARFLRVLDINNDGFDDITYSNLGSQRISVILQNPAKAGTFLSVIEIVVSTSPAEIDIADFDGNGLLDMAVADDVDDGVAILLQTASGVFKLISFVAAGNATNSVVSVDLNGNGVLDLATANENENTLSILMGDGGGGFTKLGNIAAGARPRSIVSADVNGDGTADLLSANPVAGSGIDTITVLTERGANSKTLFVVSPFQTIGGTADHLILTDVSGDGKLDALTIRNGTQLTALVQDGSSTVFAPGALLLELQENASQIARGDLVGNGLLDLITVKKDLFGDSQLRLLLRTSASAFLQLPAFDPLGIFKPITIPGVFSGVDFGDLDGNGTLKVVVSDTPNNRLLTFTVIVALGIFTQDTAQTFMTGDSPGAVTIKDINGDGLLDILSANGASVSVILQDAANPTKFLAATDLMISGPVDLKLFDINLDGKLDIVTANGLGNNVSIALQDANNPGQFAAATNVSVGSNPVSVALADLNGDGKPDIVTANNGVFGSDVGSVSVLLQDAANPGMFKDAVTVRAGSRPTAVGLADLNDDGTPDISVVNKSDGTLTVILGR
jgi:hypothetical protein